MKIVVIGAGRLGKYLAVRLAAEKHHVTVVDHEEKSLRALDESLDAELIHGYGASPQILVKAGVSAADLLLAVSSDDEANMLACLTARELGVTRTVARVMNPSYLSEKGTRYIYRNLLGIDLVVTPQHLAALEITKLTLTPGAVALGEFAKGKVHLRQLPVAKVSSVVGKKLSEIDLPGGALVAAIMRQNRVLVPRGDERFEEGDEALVIGRAGKMQRITSLFGAETHPVERVVLVGGGTIGLSIASALEAREVKVRMIEEDLDRCEELSRALNKTDVLRGDGTDTALLGEELGPEIDVFVAVSGSDATNILSGLLSREFKVKKTLVLVNRPEYVDVAERFGVDAAVCPWLLAAQDIIRYVRRGHVTSVVLRADNSAEILELVAHEESRIVGRPLTEISFPQGALVGALVRGNEVIIPRGRDQVKVGDTVVVFTLPESLPAVGKLIS